MTSTPAEETAEPHDDQLYQHIWFRGRTIALMREGFAYYQELLKADLEALRAEPALAPFLPDVESSSLGQELGRTNRILMWLDKQRVWRSPRRG
jgi:hypothetical protein